MSSVTQRIKEIKQPYGGYIPIKNFSVNMRHDGIELKSDENIHASLIGLAVDYLTRFMMGVSLEEAFNISLLGASVIKEAGNAKRLLAEIQGLDDKSIINTCKITGYDVCFRAGVQGYKPIQTIEPNMDTIFNIRTMVERSLKFWNDYGPIVRAGFTFEGGYTNIVSSGDGDYLTKDTLWDFKVSKNPTNSKYSLQLLMYYIIGNHTNQSEFNHIHNLGIYNMRLNSVYLLDISKIDSEVIDKVSNVVIGYSDIKGKVSNENSVTTSKKDSRSEDWMMPDLLRRYGVSRPKITGDFFGYGLPYKKIGQAYHFSPKDVIEWEIDQKHIPYGKNKIITLPGYIENKKYLESEIKKAKKTGDKEKGRALKYIARCRNISVYNVGARVAVTVVIMVLVLIIFLNLFGLL